MTLVEPFMADHVAFRRPLKDQKCRLADLNTVATLATSKPLEAGRFHGTIITLTTTPPSINIRPSGGGNSMVAAGFSPFGLVAILRYHANGHHLVSFVLKRNQSGIIPDDVAGIGGGWAKALREAETLTTQKGGIEAERTMVKF